MACPKIKHCIQIPNLTTVPDASGYVWLYDSTNIDKTMGKTLAKTASVPTPGPDRGDAKNTRAMVTVYTTGQDVTLVRYVLDGSGAWRAKSTLAVTAATLVELDWTILSADVLIGFLAGGTPPTTLAATMLMTEQPS